MQRATFWVEGRIWSIHNQLPSELDEEFAEAVESLKASIGRERDVVVKIEDIEW